MRLEVLSRYIVRGRRQCCSTVLYFWYPVGARDPGLTTLGIVYGACFGGAAVLVGSTLITPGSTLGHPF